MKVRDFYSDSMPFRRLAVTSWLPVWVLTTAAFGLGGCGALVGPSSSASSPYGQAKSTTTAPATPGSASNAESSPAPVQETTAPPTAKPAVAPPVKTETVKRKVVHHKPHKEAPKVVVHAAPKPKPVEKAPVATKAAPAPAPTEVAKPAPLMLTANKLPYTSGDWTLEQNWDNQHPGACRLVSKHLTMSDGYDNTAVWADVRSDHIDIHTGSNIDLSYQGVGIQFDDAALVPVKGLIGETGADVPGRFSDQMANAKNLVIHLGFWPTWPKTQTQQVQIPLAGAGVLMPSFLNCKHL